MKTRGLKIKAGYDLDGSCKYAYETNNSAPFHHQDIRSIRARDISTNYSRNSIKVLAGCAPCQPFSSYSFKNKTKDPSKYDLLYEFGRLARSVLPDIVTMENVIQILSFKEKPVLRDFIDCLKGCGYFVEINKVFCPEYGIPQTRKRLVLLASRLGDIKLISPTHNKDSYVTVRDAIGNLPLLSPGETDKKDPLHKAKKLSALNLQRIRHTPYGGSWRDWPDELVLKCHKTTKGKSFGSVYGRMVWDAPSPTITTQCTGLGNGRFGHPVQDRALSIREAALLQTFPISYKFFPDEKSIAITKASRYIGNAVPPKLGEVIADSIINHVLKVNRK